MCSFHSINSALTQIGALPFQAIGEELASRQLRLIMIQLPPHTCVCQDLQMCSCHPTSQGNTQMCSGQKRRWRESLEHAEGFKCNVLE